MTRVYVWLDRLARSPYTAPIFAGLAILSLLLSVLAFSQYATIQSQRAAERDRTRIADCRSENALRADLVEKGQATESLIRQILVIVLRPGQGSAERQLAVKGIYDQIRPEFERFEAVLESVGTQRDCRK